MAVKPVPEGYHTVTPHLTVRGAARAIEFYTRAFGAEEVARMPGPDGRLMHAALRIGDSVVFLNDEFPEFGGSPSPAGLGGTPVTIHLYVDDVDALFARAVAAGAVVRMPLEDAFWGDRYGKVADPFGHEWSLAARKEVLTPQEMARRAKAAFGG